MLLRTNEFDSCFTLQLANLYELLHGPVDTGEHEPIKNDENHYGDEHLNVPAILAVGVGLFASCPGRLGLAAASLWAGCHMISLACEIESTDFDTGFTGLVTLTSRR